MGVGRINCDKSIHDTREDPHDPTSTDVPSLPRGNQPHHHKQAELSKERARLEARMREEHAALERERFENEELMRREAAAHMAAVAAKEAEADRKMAELQVGLLMLFVCCLF